MLMEELKDKDAKLQDVRKETRESGQKLLAKNEVIAAAFVAASLLWPSTVLTSKSSPPSSSTSPAAGGRSWLQLLRFPATETKTGFCFRRPLHRIMLLFAFFVPHFQSLGREESKVSQHEVVGARSQDERLGRWKTRSGTKRFRPVKKKGAGWGFLRASTLRPMAGDLKGKNFEIYTS